MSEQNRLQIMFETEMSSVLALFWQTERDGADVMSSGRMLQSLGATSANDQSPTDTSLAKGTKRSCEVDD